MITAPFFEIGPKNLLRRHEIEPIAAAAGRAGAELGVAVVLTVPTALVAPLDGLRTGVSVFAQGMDVARLGDSMFRVTAESLADAGAAGVMLNHDSNPLRPEEITSSLARCAELGLQTIVCAGTEQAAIEIAALEPTAVLFEPASLIGSSGVHARDWIPAATAAIRGAGAGVLAMHAGGVATPEIAEMIMVAGADGTGSTSGVLTATDPSIAARRFIAATRTGWEQARRA
ncbi:triose-phosphate isomerase [Microlunatus soli]|uniref:Triosephosphate isomerase n=1 Tax=Microlunatus soli TaxID=630515 RepID=A0A1H1XU71_9ACTN|nr:triose-phosphate isomerase [Microlunatus soli]SDT12784.1 triosephosphate isomerase [Microlunatus soli]